MHHIILISKTIPHLFICVRSFVRSFGRSDIVAASPKVIQSSRKIIWFFVIESNYIFIFVQQSSFMHRRKRRLLNIRQLSRERGPLLRWKLIALASLLFIGTKYYLWNCIILTLYASQFTLLIHCHKCQKCAQVRRNQILIVESIPNPVSNW